MEVLKFRTFSNPAGIVYNPISVAEVLERLVNTNAAFTENELFEHQGLWHSFSHHGSFSHPDQGLALAGMNLASGNARSFLKTATCLVVTLGSAHVFEHKASGRVVANCHKLPGHLFERRRLGVPEVVSALRGAFEKAKHAWPHLEIIATVSPVRHLRDGLVENQRSKATLVLALDEVCGQLPYVHYFPAYELLLDDLRDYRFYEADMAHPNSQAISYIWEYFETAFFDDKTKALCRRAAQVAAAAQHRPFHPGTPDHRRFVAAQLEAIQALEADCPSLDFSRERAFFGQYVERLGG